MLISTSTRGTSIVTFQAFAGAVEKAMAETAAKVAALARDGMSFLRFMLVPLFCRQLGGFPKMKSLPTSRQCILLFNGSLGKDE
jgi:hypothetical protein